MTFVKTSNLKNFLNQICCRNNQGLQIGLMMPGETAWLNTPLPNSGIEECEKYRHFKYVDTSSDKKF